MNTVIAIDPGGTTGIAIADHEQLVFGYTQQFSDLWQILNARQPTHIVYESFRLYAHMSTHQIQSEFPSSQMIGVIRLYGELHPDVRLYPQTAAVAKQTVSDETLRGLNVYEQSVHVRDATRHLIYWHVMQPTDNFLKCQFRDFHIRKKLVDVTP